MNEETSREAGSASGGNQKNMLIAAALIILIATIGFFGYKIYTKPAPDGGGTGGTGITGTAEDVKLEKFASEAEVVAYLQKANEKSKSSNSFSMGGRGGGFAEESFDTALPSGSVSFNNPLSTNLKSSEPSRVSETNVQVLGIDESDIVKTDGNNIYFSSEGSQVMYERGVSIQENAMISPPSAPDSKIMPPRDYEHPKTKIISAFPVEGLAKIADIDEYGRLLLDKDEKILVVFSGQKIIGYDVSDPKNPEEKWSSTLEDKTYIISERLYDGKIYLVTRTNMDENDPCPVVPMRAGMERVEIACTDIYHPRSVIAADSDFSVLKINSKNGKVEDTTSFIGSTSTSQIYMSEDSIYISYAYMEDMYSFLARAITEKGKDIFPQQVIDKINKVKKYDISDESKMTEFQMIIEDYTRTLSDDEELRIENEFRNALEKYFDEHARDLEQTGIAKVSAKNLEVEATGKIPGQLLNQFSLDEYDGHLRAAVTIGSNFWGFGFGSRQSSANDIYILDEDLEITGSVKDLGLTEKIYSARFIGNRGYLVTFRQIDPFYVLDLSDPKKPEMKGELKIPGYSSYLHPLKDNIILGVGEESGKVKLSIFDVSSPSDPREIDKYILDEYWSEAGSNHHAFLQDSKHEVFFLPGGQGGYVFSYEGNKLSLKRAISDYQVKRAVYINDYLYIIGENKITVLNEKNWEKVKDLDL